jgi:hypothetical protein
MIFFLFIIKKYHYIIIIIVYKNINKLLYNKNRNLEGRNRLKIIIIRFYLPITSSLTEKTIKKVIQKKKKNFTILVKIFIKSNEASYLCVALFLFFF